MKVDAKRADGDALDDPGLLGSAGALDSLWGAFGEVRLLGECRSKMLPSAPLSSNASVGTPLTFALMNSRPL